jgi:hypothetical protein
MDDFGPGAEGLLGQEDALGALEDEGGGREAFLQPIHPLGRRTTNRSVKLKSAPWLGWVYCRDNQVYTMALEKDVIVGSLGVLGEHVRDPFDRSKREKES